MNELKFLGRGSAFNIKEGNTCGYFKSGTSLLIVDCGCSMYEKIVKSGILNDVDDVYIAITHLHGDHAGGLGALLDYLYWKKSIVATVIFPYKEMKAYLSLSMIKEYQYEESGGLVLEDFGEGTLNIHPFKTLHVDKNEKTSGYFIQYIKDNKSTYFIIDWDAADVNDDIINFIAKNKDSDIYWYHDASSNANEFNGIHCSYKTLITRVPEFIRNKCYFVHLDDTEFLEKIAEENRFKVAQIEE